MRNHPLLSLLVVALPLYLFPAVPFGPEPIRWDWLVILTILGAFGVGLARDRNEPVLRLDRPQLWLLVFIVFVILSVARPLLSGRPGSVVDFATTGVQVTMNAALFIVLAHLDSDERSIAGVLRIYILVGVVIAGFGVAQSLLANVFGTTVLFPFSWTSLHYPTYFPLEIGTPGRYDTLGIYRATSIFAEPRHLGNFLVTPMLIGIATLSRPRTRLLEHRRTLLISTCVLGLGVVVSVSASALLVTALGLIALPLLTLDDPRKIVRGYILGGLTSGVVVLVGYAFDITLITRTIGRFIPRPYELQVFMDFAVPVTGPVKYLRGVYLALRESIAHPILGVGLNQVHTSIDVSAPIVIVPPFLLLASIGIPGFFAFVAFITTALSNMVVVKARYHERSTVSYWLLTVAIILFVMAVVKSVFGSKYNYPNTWFWFDIGLAYMIYRNTLPEQFLDHHRDSSNHRTFIEQ